MKLSAPKINPFCQEQAVSSYTHGFKGAYLLRDPGSDKGISVIFWETVEDMTDNQNEAHEAILKKMPPLFAHTPDVFVYEVVSELKPALPQPQES